MYNKYIYIYVCIHICIYIYLYTYILLHMRAILYTPALGISPLPLIDAETFRLWAPRHVGIQDLQQTQVATLQLRQQHLEPGTPRWASKKAGPVVFF